MTVLDKEIRNLWPSAPQLGISQAVRVGDIVYVAGTPGVRDDFSIPPDVGEQMRLAYGTIARILATFGASLANVVDQTVFVTDIDAAFAAGQVRLDAYAAAGGDLPASAMVQVARLAHPDLKVEPKFPCDRPAATARRDLTSRITESHQQPDLRPSQGD
jgi:2-iminobutanoate/2-iminopropanoate deaminase